MNSRLLLGIILLCAGLFLDVVGTAIPYWWVLKGSIANMGLFQVCSDVLGTNFCVSISSSALPGWWKAVQACMIISILVLAAAIGLAILFAIMKEKKVLAIFSGLAGGAGAGLAILGAIIFASKVGKAEALGGLHAGFGLAIVGAVGAIPGALMMLLSMNST